MLYSWSAGHHSLLLLVCKPSQFTAFLLVCRPTELSVLLLVCKPQVAVQLVHCYWSVGHSLVYCYCRLSQCSELPQTCKSSKFSLSSFHQSKSLAYTKHPHASNDLSVKTHVHKHCIHMHISKKKETDIQSHNQS